MQTLSKGRGREREKGEGEGDKGRKEEYLSLMHRTSLVSQRNELALEPIVQQESQPTRADAEQIE